MQQGHLHIDPVCNWSVYLVLILQLLFHIEAPLITEVRVAIQCCRKGALFREGSRRAEGREDCSDYSVLCDVYAINCVECSGK